LLIRGQKFNKPQELACFTSLYLKEVSGQHPLLFCLEDESSRLLFQNVGNFIPDCRALHNRRHYSPYFISLAECLLVEGLLKQKFCECCIST
jgi:hypothetical protein